MTEPLVRVRESENENLRLGLSMLKTSQELTSPFGNANFLTLGDIQGDNCHSGDPRLPPWLMVWRHQGSGAPHNSWGKLPMPGSLGKHPS